MKIYILLMHYNEYDQHGGYFVSAHSTRLSAEIAAGRVGRLGDEYKWYEVVDCELDSPCMRCDSFGVLVPQGEEK